MKLADKVTPFLWFDKNAEKAARFYVTLFPRSKIIDSSAMTTTFDLAGRRFVALNGGPYYTLTPAFSMFVSCKDQREVDALWKQLLARGGKPSRCGWLVDRFGLSWQIVPDGLQEIIADPRGMAAMLKMVKLDIAKLRAAVQDDDA